MARFIELTDNLLCAAIIAGGISFLGVLAFALAETVM